MLRHKDFWIALGIGALMGGIAALLYAPQSGARTRRQIKRSVADAGEALEEATAYLKEQADALAKQAQSLVDAGKSQLNSAVDAVKGTASQASDALDPYLSAVSNASAKTSKAAQRLM